MVVADPTEPLILADGTKIDPSTGEIIKDKKQKFVAVPSPTEAQALVIKSRRALAELPAPPQQLTGVALVAFYTLFGLSDQDIALACDSKISIDQISRIRELDAYKEFMTSAKQAIVDTTVDTVREKFQQNAVKAAEKVLDLVDSDNDVLAFKASQDVLDRAGHRPADTVEHRHKMEDALHIVVTRRDEGQEAPVIDVTPTMLEVEE